jgi:MFS transporter, YNFM family, putative membrane transport protein
LFSLALLAIPTSLLAVAPSLTVFTVLRVIQGLFMASAFTLTLAYLAEHCSTENTAGAFAAYITGNVASNLFGRLMSAALADHLGLAANFYVFALLNLGGAVLIYFSLARAPAMAAAASAAASPLTVWREHLRNGSLRVCFAIGFCCSRSSARLLTSILCWCAILLPSEQWRWALCVSCCSLRSSRPPWPD